MTAVACLRVAVTADSTGLAPAVLGPLVEKFSSAYLETRWSWPRRFAPLSRYSFLLSDPRSDVLDVQELARLSDDLQVKLFGTAGSGEVALLLFEGPAEVITTFAALDVATVLQALTDPSLLPPGGKLTRIVAEPQAAPAVMSHQSHAEQVVDLPEAAPSGVASPDGAGLRGAQGIYFTLKSFFIGDVMTSIPYAAGSYMSLVEGPDRMPTDQAAFDADCVAACLHFLRTPGESMLYLPLSYSNLARPSSREAYRAMLSTLPASRRKQLAATIYEVPRSPSFATFSELTTMLTQYFSHIDLCVSDPGFEVEKLAPQSVHGVTLILPQADQRARLAVLRRFAERREFYRKRKIWSGVSNVRNKLELDACAALNVPFISGPAVCQLRMQLVGGRMHDLGDLPVLAA